MQSHATYAPTPYPPSFDDFRRQHRSVEDAFTAFSAALKAHYDYLLQRPSCVFCGRGNPNTTVQFEWFTVVFRGQDLVRDALLAGLGVGGGTKLSCSTYHAACRGCFRSWRLRSRAWVMLGTISLVSGLGGLLLGLMFLAFAYLGHPVKPSDRAGFQLYGWLGVAIGIGGLIVHFLARRWCVPGPLRLIPIAPVWYGSASLVEECSRDVTARP